MLLSVDATWKTCKMEVEAAIHLDVVSDIILARVEQLGRRTLKLLEVGSRVWWAPFRGRT